jgi:hypothetical protein
MFPTNYYFCFHDCWLVLNFFLLSLNIFVLFGEKLSPADKESTHAHTHTYIHACIEENKKKAPQFRVQTYMNEKFSSFNNRWMHKVFFCRFISANIKAKHLKKHIAKLGKFFLSFCVCVCVCVGMSVCSWRRGRSVCGVDGRNCDFIGSGNQTRFDGFSGRIALQFGVDTRSG